MNLDDDPERLDDVIMPALAFDSPMDVVEDADLTLGEKRSLLAAWASDARAVESNPTLRRAGTQPVSVDEILTALRVLDRSHENDAVIPARKVYRKSSIEAFRVNSDRLLRSPPD